MSDTVNTETLEKDLTEEMIDTLKKGQKVKIGDVVIGRDDNGNVLAAKGLTLIATLAWQEIKKLGKWLLKIVKWAIAHVTKWIAVALVWLADQVAKAHIWAVKGTDKEVTIKS